jgi:predicted nucleic acid-binding protein
VVYGLPVTGTGGILLAAKQAGLVHQIRPLMLAMKANGYFLSDRLVEGICRAVGE